MRMNKRIFNIMLVIIYSSLILVGCNKEVKDEFVKIDISQGSIVRDNLGDYKTYLLRDKNYFQSDIDEAIYAYDKTSGHYIYEKDNKRIVRTNNNRIEIKDTSIKKLLLAPGGNYVSYFVNDGQNKLSVLDLEANKNIVMDSKVSISGELMDWLDEDTMVYYGIDKDKKNGIFTYDINTGEETLFYEINNGYLLYLEKIESGFVFLQATRNGAKSLNLLDSNKKITKIQGNIENIYDVEETQKGIFVLGSSKGNIYSVYKVENNKLKRLLYDYPSILHYEKGLSSDEEGNVIFIGGMEGFDKELIYKYDNGDVYTFNDDIGKYYFIKVK